MLGGSTTHRTLVLQAGFLEVITKLLFTNEFDFQREAVFAVRNACAVFAVRNACVDASVPALLLNRDFLGQIVLLLQVPDSDVALACMQILRAIVQPQSPTVDVCAELGLFDVLDSLQYAPGEEDVKRAASRLSDELVEDEEDSTFIPQETVFSFPITQTVVGDTRGFEHVEGSSLRAVRGMGRGSHLTKPSWKD